MTNGPAVHGGFYAFLVPLVFFSSSLASLWCAASLLLRTVLLAASPFALARQPVRMLYCIHTTSLYPTLLVLSSTCFAQHGSVQSYRVMGVTDTSQA